MKINERFIWALSVLNPQSSDNILEIGCGAGLFADLICQQLVKGKYTAVDRSQSMIKMARKRVTDGVESGKAIFHETEFSCTNFPNASFHKIVAFNVNVFWKDPKKEMELIRSYLKPKGLFYLFYQHPYESTLSVVEKAKQPLMKEGFVIVDAVLQQMKPYSAFCVISKPA